MNMPFDLLSAQNLGNWGAVLAATYGYMARR